MTQRLSESMDGIDCNNEKFEVIMHVFLRGHQFPKINVDGRTSDDALYRIIRSSREGKGESGQRGVI